MTETRRVRAKPGAMLADLQRQKAFIGYREVTASEPADHVVPGGKRYAIVPEGVVVPNNAYVRRGIAAGSLEDLDAVAAQPAEPKPATTGVMTRQKRED
jgi:hypothetical protein